MLIIHSDRDYRCSIDGALAAFNVLQMMGVPSKFLNFPDEVCFPCYLLGVFHGVESNEG